MEPLALIAFGLFALIFGLVSRKIEKTDFSPTLIFTAAGVVVGPVGFGLIDLEPGDLHTLGEWTLILLLFADASRIDLGALRVNASVPSRMLGIGMPLTIGLGFGVGVLLFPEYGLPEVALLAVLLAPTDAALGQAVVSASIVPQRIRQALNVESGLNDGIALPFVMFFAAAASQSGGRTPLAWLGFWGQQVGVGVGVGILVGLLGGRLLRHFHEAGWISPAFERIAAIAVVVLAVGLSEFGGGNAFIAAFVGGLTVGNTARDYVECVHEFVEAEGQILTLIVFALVGAVLVGPAVANADLRSISYALASLTVVRGVPVALSLLGTKASAATTVFVGWFGPRGLATVLFGLLVLESFEIPHGSEIFHVAMLTVVLSILLHGVTARRGSNWYGKHIAAHEGMEHETVQACRLRNTAGHPSAAEAAEE